MENGDTFFGYLVNFVVIWHILFTLGMFYGHLVVFYRVAPRKIWQPWPRLIFFLRAKHAWPLYVYLQSAQ
jgi:hypothetical protein